MRVALATSPALVLSFLAFDFGTRRVGVATGNSLTGAATPLTTIDAVGEARLVAIGRLVNEWRPTGLVVGVPFHPDGAAHVNTRRARAFARQLQSRFGLPVHEVDERYSTTSARASTTTVALASESRVAGRRFHAHPGSTPNSGELDARSAAIILEQHLAALP